MATLNNYQQLAKNTAIYPNAGTGDDSAITYTILGLVGEAGELANKWKKQLRGDKNREDIIGGLRGELGDVLWYVAMLADELGMTLDHVAQTNLDKLSDRKERDQLKGSGDER